MTGDAPDPRDRLLDAALPHVAFDGWSDAALRAGARDLGGDAPHAGLVFPGGARDAITRFSRRADRSMADAAEASGLAGMRVSERVALVVRARLDGLAPWREAVRRGAAWLALPHNQPLGFRLLCHTVDDAWHAAGDRSADFSFYTRRALLAGAVATTTLFWLDDDSEAAAATAAFLDRRLGDALRIRRARSGIERAGRTALLPLRALGGAALRRYRADGVGSSRVT